ncbi:MAG: hypothetical protein U0894_07405 [Pirellulales bacterium]
MHRGTTSPAERYCQKARLSGRDHPGNDCAADRYRQGIKGLVWWIPANATKAYYPCFLPEWCATDLTRRIVVHGVTVIPDPQGKPRLLTKAGDARITMILEGHLKAFGRCQRDDDCAGQTLETSGDFVL